ncbi:MAG: glycosyltransferase family 39 protein [Candidatus Dormibacteria bacterium]
MRPSDRAAPRVGVLDGVALAVLAVITLGTRLLFRSRYLYNWDSIQYALGVIRFDLVAHRPHPPGYAGYIVLGRVFTGLAGGDPGTGLVVLSAVAEAAAVVLLFLFARECWGRFAGWSAAVLFASSPLAWVYGGVALNYALEPVLVVAVTWACLRACRGSRSALVLAAALVAAAGAIRPTDELFLAAPLTWAAWRAFARRDWRGVGAAAAVLLVATVAWVIPLLVASGGLRVFLEASRELSAKASDTSAIWKAGLPGVWHSGAAVVAGLATALGLVVPVALAYVVCARLVGGAPSRRRSADLPILAAAVLVPSLCVYVFIHIGQLGYLLLLVPTLIAPAGMLIERLAAMVSRQRQNQVAGVVLAACVLANVLIFALPAGGMRDQVASHDAYVTRLLAAVQRHDPSTTVLLTSAEADGSYRLAQYYLPAYAVIAIGRDNRKKAGEMFATGEASPTAPEYDLNRFDHAGELRLPAETRTVLVLDGGALALLGNRSRATAERFGLGWKLWRVRLDTPGDAVAFGPYVYLLPGTCPCRGATATFAVRQPHQPTL